MVIGTIFSLFALDFVQLALPPSVDNAFTALTFFFFILFTIDIILQSLAKPGYFGRLNFWLDVLATVSLVPDIPFLWDIESGSASTANDGGSLAIARAGRAARAGTRAGRLVRLFKLFSLCSSKKKSQQAESVVAPSAVGNQLGELATRKVIIGVMLMVTVLPFLDASSTDDSDVEALIFMASLASIPLGSTSNNSSMAVLEATTETYLNSKEDGEVLYLEIDGEVFVEKDDEVIDSLRSKEIDKWLAEKNGVEGELWLDVKSTAGTEALFNILLIVFIIAMLAISSFLFTRDANSLMIRPIQRMVSVVRMLSENPLADLEEYLPEHEEQEATYETAEVEKALLTIGGLLQVGFGEAGAKVIGKNLRNGGSIDPMIPGARMQAIFGFCDIRGFSEVTETLEEQVMPFVNRVAHIVHTNVKANNGSPNKNIGEAFLVAYKTSSAGWERMDRMHVVHRNELVSREKRLARDLANRALTAFLDVMVDIETDEVILQAVKNPKLQRVIPNYKINMGFGLHYGWAIEGAIGSRYKIDASYLSPHVNMAARLESATRSYGVSILISGPFFDLLSPALQSLCRNVDKVTVKGSAEPMRLYTVDVEPEGTAPSFPGIQDYRKLFETAVSSYIAGKWNRAGDQFQHCLELWPEDAPARVLLFFMSRHNFRAPSDWPGFRALQNK